jgi:hypothetical protein
MRALHLVLCAGFVAAMPTGALACRCKEPSPAAAYRQAASAVLGEIRARRDEGGGRTTYTVEVARSWKHDVTGTVTVETGTTCRFDAEVGRRYLLFLGASGGGRYYTRRCMGDRQEGAASETLRFLENAAQRRPRRR